MLTAFDAESWAPAALAPARVPAAAHLSASRTGGATHKDVYINAGPAAADARARPSAGCFHTEMLMDELADKVEDGSARVPHQEPAAGSARTRCGGLLSRSRRETFGWSKRHPTGDPTPGPIKTRHGLRGEPVGRRRPRLQGALRDHVRWQRRQCAAARRTSAPARARACTMIDGRDARHPDGDGEGRDRRQRTTRSAAARRQHDGAACVARDPRDVRARHATRCRRRSRRRSAWTRRPLSPCNGRIQVERRRVEGPAVEGRVQLLGTEPVSVGRGVEAWPLGERHERRAVRRSRSGHRDRRHEGHAHRLRPGLRARSSIG